MSFKSKRETLILVIIYCGLSILGIGICEFIQDIHVRVSFLCMLAVLHMIFTAILLYRIQKKVLTITNLFISFSYIFNLGQIIILACTSNYEYQAFELRQYTSDEYLCTSTQYVILILTFFVLGIIVANLHLENKKRPEIFFDNHELIKMRRIGLLVIIATFPVHLNINIEQILAYQSNGYFEIFELNTSGVIAIYSQFLIIGLTLFLLSMKDKKRVFVCLYLVIVGYFLITMLSGSRGKAVICIVYFSFLFFKIMKITYRRALIIFVIGYLGIGVLTSIASLRGDSDMSVEKITDNLKEVNEPLLRGLEEFGNTQYTVVLTQKYIDEGNTYQGGMSYLQSLASILPNIGGKLTEINDKAIFNKHLPGSAYFGGSNVGELYYNFGWFGCVPALFVGWIIGKISKRIEVLFEEKRYIEISYYALAIVNLFWWIRDSFPSLCRSVVWSILFIWILCQLYDRIVERLSKRRYMEI